MSRSKRWDVVGVGCNSVDYVHRVAALPQANSPTAKQRLSGHSIMCGGQMATALAACASFGLKTAYLGAVGGDPNGRLIAEQLHQRGVDTSLILTRDCANRFAVITVDDESGDRFILWDRDERLNLLAAEIDVTAVGSARLVHVDNEDEPAAIAAARIARAADTPVTSDIDRVTAQTLELIDLVTVPILAEHVLGELTGVTDPERALRQLRRPHHAMACVTLGAAGAVLLVDDDVYHQPAVAIRAVDTTGAGDVFRAGFIYGLLSGYAARGLLAFANAAAAQSCTRAGAMAGVPSLDEVQQLLSGASAPR
jgi:sulfofructose kinase